MPSGSFSEINDGLQSDVVSDGPGCLLCKAASQLAEGEVMMEKVDIYLEDFPLDNVMRFWGLSHRCPFSFGNSGTTKCQLLLLRKKNKGGSYEVRCPQKNPETGRLVSYAAHPNCPLRQGTITVGLRKKDQP